VKQGQHTLAMAYFLSGEVKPQNFHFLMNITGRNTQFVVVLWYMHNFGASVEIK